LLAERLARGEIDERGYRCRAGALRAGWPAGSVVVHREPAALLSVPGLLTGNASPQMIVAALPPAERCPRLPARVAPVVTRPSGQW
jgi:hypothetical protein